MDSQNQQQDQQQGQAQAKAAEPKSQLQGLEGFFDTYLREKAPFQFPAKGREWIVQYGPWISLVFLILGALVLIPVAMIALGLTALTLPFQAAAGTVTNSGLNLIGLVISLAVLVMEAIAIPALLKRKMSGWKMLYYAGLVSAVGSIISMNFFGAIIGLVIGMYILFQIRSYYK